MIRGRCPAIAIALTCLQGLGAAAATAAEPHPAVSALPEIARLDGYPTTVVVRGDLPPRRAKRWM